MNIAKGIPRIDELQYFHRSKICDDEYRSFFQDTKIGVDISPTYILDVEALKRIKRYNQRARIVVLLREPQERDASALRYVEARGRLSNDTKTHAWVTCGSEYEKYMSNLFEIFPSDQIRLVLYEDLIKDTRETVSDILKFFLIDQKLKLVIDESKTNESIEPRIQSLKLLLKIFRPLVKTISPTLWNYLRNSKYLKNVFFREAIKSNNNEVKDQVYIKQI